MLNGCEFHEGTLVELRDLPEDLDPAEHLGSEAVRTSIKPNGKQGKILEFDSNSARYIVELFDAVRLAVPRANLQVYEPPPPSASGGFHLVWPSTSGRADVAAEFAARVAVTLQDHDFCVVQMFFSAENGKRLVEEAASKQIRYKRMKREFESAYFGHKHKSKGAFLPGLAEEKEELTTVLDLCDNALSTLTGLLVPLAPCALDFTPYSRTNAMVRVPLGAAEETRFQGEELEEDDISDGLVDEHIQFLKRRHLCMLLIAESEGGELTFIPKDGNREDVVIGTSRGRLIVFRTDCLSYVYRPYSHVDVVLQSWVLAPPDQLQSLNLETDQAAKDEAMGLLAGPGTPAGLRTDTIGISVGFPAGGESEGQAFWAMVAAGTDGQTKAPFARFDMDVYFRPEDTWNFGFTYTQHGGFCQYDIYALDNDFFNIKEDEAVFLAPANRCLLERGYEAMYKSSYTRTTVKGKKIGIFVGHSGDDWSMTKAFTWPHEGKDCYRAAYAGRIWSTIASRLAYTFDLKGPQSLTDTACSSALVAYGVGHSMLRREELGQGRNCVDVRLNEGLMLGANMMPGPGNYINLCGPHMLSAKGRCFTFDVSADGFERAEGCGGFLCRNQITRTPETTCTMIGACLNQDGRSASMTAPNGPAQQECIRGSMKEAGIRASEVTCAELHGTGTALGDPIEVGSLKGVMQDRGEVPLMQCSAKAHIGHLEAGAGCAGVIKCMLMCAACAGSPNCHLVSLNPHLDINGYPTIIATELSDFGGNSGYSGVSSFGFGGANSRADVFASSTLGPHKCTSLNLEKIDFITVTCPFDEGPIHYLDGKAVGRNAARQTHGPYHANAIRDEFATYDYSSALYIGKYQLEPPGEPYEESPSDPIHIVGTWDAFRASREMKAGDDGDFTFHVALGESRCERFQLRVDNDPARAIYPVAKDGSMRTRVVGPDDSGEGYYWLLDGRDEEVATGTLYRITLLWGEQPTMSWEPVKGEAGYHGTHRYCVLGTWTSWTCSEMLQGGKDKWSTCVRVGMTGAESFRFARDADESQLIYPSQPQGPAGSVACGPDDWCNDRSWLVTGNMGEMVNISLEVQDAHVVVHIDSPSVGTRRVVHSEEGSRRHSFQISGTFNGSSFEDMSPDDREPGVYRYQAQVGESGQEFFTVAVDGDPGLTLYPEMDFATPGEAIVRGPDQAAEGKVFTVSALAPGARFEVVLDRHAADKRKVIDVRWLSPRADLESMTAACLSYFGR